MNSTRIFLLVLLIAVVSLVLDLVGETQRPLATRTIMIHAATPPTAACDPPLGKGTMGACSPAGPPAHLSPTAAGARLIPDVSEFQGCALHSEAIFRVYEAGTEREDSRAVCHAAEIHHLHVWGAAYAFLRAGHGGCVFQADRTVQIANSVGGVDLIVGDSEVGLRGGFPACFKREVERKGYPEVEYTCPGCGDEQTRPVWIASYPTRPAGTWVAHQFSSNFTCRGITGDCSINEGILAIHRGPSPAERHTRRVREARHLHALYAERVRIRRHLLNSGCRVKHPRRACTPLFRRGAAVNHEIAVLRARGVH